MKTATILIFMLLALTQPIYTQTEKEQQKARRKAVKEEINKRTVDFVQLTKFPGTYTGRPLRLERAAITDVQGMTDQGTTFYLMALAKDTESTMAFLLADKVTFATEESTAKDIVSHIDGMRKGGIWPRDFNPVADIYFELFQRNLNNRRYYVAKVSCVGIYGVFSKLTFYGDCNLDVPAPPPAATPSTGH